MKKNAFFGLLVILLVFGFIGCDNNGTDGNDGTDDNDTVTVEWIADHPSNDTSAPDYIIISLNNDFSFIWQEEKNLTRYNVLKGTFHVFNSGNITMIITHGWTDEVTHWDNSEQIMNNIKAYYAPDLLFIGQINENTLTLGVGGQEIELLFSKNNN